MKSIIIFLLTVISTVCFAQITVTKSVDEMTDKAYYITNKNLVVATPDLKTGFIISPMIDKVNNSLVVNNIIIEYANIGGCNEDNILIIKFVNGEKVVLTSWNDFNCDDTSYFTITPYTYNLLKSNVIDVIRFTNGRTHDSYTGKPNIPNYFILLAGALRLCKP